MPRTNLAVLGFLATAMLLLGCVIAASEPNTPPRRPSDDRRVEAVVAFADNVLKQGRDRWSGRNTPLFTDGVNVDTGEPVEWVFKGQRWIVSNLASQQNLFRTLTGLSRLRGQPRYRAAAEAATRYHLDHLRHESGLLFWGGHRFIDLRTLKVVGEQNSHEFKCSYPYYDLLWEMDPKAAERFIKAFWNAHVLDWSNLDMNRHGAYGRPMGALWASRFVGAEPFFKGKGLTFINCGSDLVYAAGMLRAYTGDAGSLAWSKRLAEQYVRARDPNTGLGAYQFSQIASGDRAKLQLSPEFGERALEGRVLDPSRATTIYGRVAISQLRLGERLGKDGCEFIQWTRSGLAAYARQAYDPRSNMLTAMFTDGTKLAPESVKRPGYYSAGSFRPESAGTMLLLSYALGYRLTGDELLWQMARSIAKGHGLGDLGAAPGQGVRVNTKTACADPLALFGLLEILRTSKNDAYLELARRIGDNIVAARFHKGFFVPSENHVNACFDALEPLALLSLEAHLRGTPDVVPAYPGGRGYIHGPYDGLGRTYDSQAIWSKTREPVPSAADWIDSQTRLMWAIQKPDGVIEGWHGDGNFARTTIMYCLWKTQGLTVRPWREDVAFGAVRDGDGLSVVLSARQNWRGKVLFDGPRHKTQMKMPLDWPRINQFPEWFTVEADARYAVRDMTTGPEKTLSGREMQDGIAVEVKPDAPVRWRIEPAKP